MALQATGLTDVGLGAGLTTNFQVQYESTLPNRANVVANANALLAVLENEFVVTTGWFNTPGGKFGTGQRQIVNLNLPDNSGANNAGYGSAINMDAQSGNGNAADAAERVKMLFMNEWVEILISLTQGKWNAGDSIGEGLSQYCGIVRFPAGTYSYYGSFVNQWLNRAPRPAFGKTTKPTDKDPCSFGCALVFLFYLNSQLNFTIHQILAAGAPTLATVYQTLTGKNVDPFPDFLHQIRTAYPGTSTITGPNPDNPYPLGKNIAWHNSSTNETQIWFMKDERVVRRGTVLGENGAPAFGGPPWRIVGTGDMNGDGQSDIVWHNSSTNETQIWFLDGEQVVRRGTVLGENGAPAFVGPPWRIVGTGDANGDVLAEIVWHNSSTNETQIWFLNAERVVRRGTVLGENGAPALVGPPWRIAAVGDIDTNGTPDIVWHNSSTNETQIWFMNAERVVRRGTVLGENGAPAFVGPPWNIVGAGDMNGGGSSDIGGHNSSTNETQIWFMNAERVVRRGTVLGENGAPAFVGPPWNIVATSDMNGDGQAEIMWHNSSTNETQIWFMTAERVLRS